MAVDEPGDEKTDPIDWEDLRKRSLLPGGFGPSRAQIWPSILGVCSRSEKEVVTDEHCDESQIRLDTDRSFVLYPVDTSINDKEQMQENLNQLLVSVFRRHPKLNYFQGYHDIVSVLYLTLPEEMQLACAEKISLHRVRDSMGPTLEPVLGLLRVTKNLLRLADPEYARRLECSSQLPFYALSNLLTLFSHDIPTLPLIQHVFDYILCRPPIIIVYLVTATIISRKGVLQQLENKDEDEDLGMAHSILSTLPSITDEKETEGAKVEDDDQESIGSGKGQEVKVEEREPEPEIKESVEGTGATEPMMPLSKEQPPDENFSTSPPVTSCPSTPLHRPDLLPPIQLTSLLAQADDLYNLYPPSHPDLSLSSIMGPQSVVYTWSESFSALPTDVEAEAMVLNPGLIVYPYIGNDVVEESEDSEEWEEKPGPGKSKRKQVRGKFRGKMKEKLRRLRRGRVDQTTGMVAGAVIVLGVALAVYGVKMREKHPGAAIGFLDSHGRDWKKIVAWAGGAVTGVTERVVNRLSASASNGQ
ncbi:hypothetical protein C0993_011224 [Termitomyces sp. T159_Od127]|nr:hypothetical protein C0993_011224 [Termitomyces sp. T159_Od127]